MYPDTAGKGETANQASKMGFFAIIVIIVIITNGLKPLVKEHWEIRSSCFQ